jgi:spore coat protein A
LSFSNKMPFTVIGSDGGYLQRAATVTSLTISPGERYDILVDFSAVPLGTKIIMKNTARAPFPGGPPADPQTVGQIMQFTVKASSANPGAAAPVLPAALNPTLPAGVFPTLAAPPATQQRVRTLFEVMGPAGPLLVTINGQPWDGVFTETPKNGTTEDWIIVNLTGDTHPIHIHLATFQLVSRQKFQANKYTKDWLALNAAGDMPPFPVNYVPVNLDPTAYLQGKAAPALPTEMGWKDTVQMNPSEVTIIRIRFLQQDGSAYPFDPSQGPGYVWHCHIVDHEDNEMMRPYQVLP